MDVKLLKKCKLLIKKYKKEQNNIRSLIDLSHTDMNEEEKYFLEEKYNKILPEPGRLVVISKYNCDFCMVAPKSESRVYQLYLNFGFQACENCLKLNKPQSASINYSIRTKCVGYFEFRRWFPENHFFNKTDNLYKIHLYINRSDGSIDKWYMSQNNFVMQKRADIYFIVTDGVMIKAVPLTELKDLNPEIYECEKEIREKFKIYTNK